MQHPKLLATLLLGTVAATATVRAQGEIFVAFGDSITEGLSDELGFGGYPPRLQVLLREGGMQGTQVRNRGVAGEDTTEALSRIGSVLGEGGDHLILMEGTNDIVFDIALETTIFNLALMADLARQRGMGVVLGTLTPRWQFAVKDRTNFETRLISQSVRDLAGKQDYLLSDVFDVWFHTPNFSPDLYGIPGDPVGHPNAEGYDLMASIFADVILGVDSVPPVPGLSSPQNFAGFVSPDTSIDLDIWDFGDGIELGKTFLRINGVPVATDITGNSKKGHASFAPRSELVGVVTVGLSSSDLADPPNVADRDVLFFDVFEGSPFPGDLDYNGRVDGLDLTFLGLSFGADRQNSRFILGADLDGNGTVDGDDLAILAGNFGSSP